MSLTTAHPPELQVSEWLNTPEPLSLAALRGQVVVVHAFQMLCPGCVAHGLPQAKRLTQVFAGRDLAVIGMHTVFEHHAVMTPAASDAAPRNSAAATSPLAIRSDSLLSSMRTSQ